MLGTQVFSFLNKKCKKNEEEKPEDIEMRREV